MLSAGPWRPAPPPREHHMLPRSLPGGPCWELPWDPDGGMHPAAGGLAPCLPWWAGTGLLLRPQTHKLGRAVTPQAERDHLGQRPPCSSNLPMSGRAAVADGEQLVCPAGARPGAAWRLWMVGGRGGEAEGRPAEEKPRLASRPVLQVASVPPYRKGGTPPHQLITDGTER